jgi:predicted ArsR family transcriptional regulator
MVADEQNARRAATDPHVRRPATDPHVRRPATESEARTLASAVRLRILRLCLDDDLTNKEIADRLGRDPASVLHHVRRLVDDGFVQALPPRRGNRGARERPYRATRKSWELSQGEGDVEELGRSSDAMLQAFLAEAAEAGTLQSAARLGLTLGPAQLEEFLDRLQVLLDEYARRPPDPDGIRWSVFFAMHRDRRGVPPE